MSNPPSVLIVDSNKAFATMLQESLEQEGQYRATAAGSGDEALQAISAEAFDLAIVDLGLDGSDGTVVARELRQQQSDLCLMLIPLEGEEVPAELADISIQGTLTKPFFLPDLPDCIEKALEEPIVSVEPSEPPEPSEPSEPAEPEEIIEQTAEEDFEDFQGLEDFDVPKIAGELKRLSREINADAVILTRSEDVIASAGRIQADKLKELAQVVAKCWRTSVRMAQILGREQRRFEQSVEGGEYVFYSLAIAEEVILSMAMRTKTPLGIIRHQAKKSASALKTMIAQ
jgi:CheY-like chemotaxis protein